jgi:hypothetical protein
LPRGGGETFRKKPHKKEEKKVQKVRLSEKLKKLGVSVRG